MNGQITTLSDSNKHKHNWLVNRIHSSVAIIIFNGWFLPFVKFLLLISQTTSVNVQSCLKISLPNWFFLSLYQSFHYLTRKLLVPREEQQSIDDNFCCTEIHLLRYACVRVITLKESVREIWILRSKKKNKQRTLHDKANKWRFVG